MSRLGPRFQHLQAQSRCALVPFITAGDPSPEVTVATMRALVEAGADVIELGVPFSDPMADGPVIQKASERALAGGMSVDGVLAVVREFRAIDDATPVVLMGYLNPLEMRGYQSFAEAAQAAGVDGVLVVDLPPEESGKLQAELRSRDLDLIFLVAPNSSPERVGLIAGRASGYLYYVSLKGVTGSAALDVSAVSARVQSIKTATDLPVGVGFGIRDAETAAQVATVSDAVVVGTVLVEQAERFQRQPDKVPEAVAAIVADMRAAMDVSRSGGGS